MPSPLAARCSSGEPEKRLQASHPSTNCKKRRCAKWWIPDDVAFVEKIPLTATGKISKVELRQQFKDFRFGAGS